MSLAMKNTYKNGITLVELLVVISIMTIITALLIPRLRLINKDRNIRETARVVGSLVSIASNQAVSDGVAGVLFQRNANFVEATQGQDGRIHPVYFASTRMFLLRKVPHYTGDQRNAMALVEIDNLADPVVFVVSIPLPLDHEPNRNRFVVRRNDKIRFGGSSILYTITTDPFVTVNGNGDDILQFQLDYNDGDPDNDTTTLDVTQADIFRGTPAPRTGNQTFSIERQPRVVESSAVELPAGYIVDLRYSGALDLGDFDMDGIHEGEDNNATTFSKFGLANGYNTDGGNAPASDVAVIFDESGGIGSVIYNNYDVVFGQSLSLFITEYDVNNANLNTVDVNIATQTSRNVLSVPETLWVTINNSTGGVSVGNNNIPAPAANTGFDIISSARFLSRFRTDASQ